MADVIELAGRRKTKTAAADDIVRHDAAVAQVRAILLKFRAAEGGACIDMMDLGGVLIPIRATTGYRAWGNFLRDCGLPKRDAQIALQLARARPQIEVENAKRASLLSIRQALALIRPPKKRSPSGKQSSGESQDHPLLAAWKRLSAVGRQAGLAAINADELLAALPAELFETLNGRLRAQFIRAHPKAKLVPTLAQVLALPTPDGSAVH